jgi:hypothetical protein
VRRLTPRERRMVGAAAFVSAAVAAWLLVLLPLSARRERISGEIGELRSRLVASHGLLSDGRGYREEVELLGRSVKEREGKLFAGEQSSLLGARLQKLYKDMAEASGLSVRSEQVLEPETVGGITVVPVEITVGGHTGQLDGFLEAVEGYDHLLRVDRLSVRVPNVLKPVQVTAVARISGFLLPGGAP